MKEQTLLLGVDGGATKVSVWEIIYNPINKTYALGKNNATRSYREINGYIPGFSPVNLNIQLKERNVDSKPTLEEEQQSGVYVEACAQAIKELYVQKNNLPVLMGIGMPGLKTADKRGIAVVANGPRMLDYAQNLEQRLNDLGVSMAAPISHLGSDADYCGIGENYAEDGLFRNSNNAYYLGGGTGVADALKLKGDLITFDNARAWIAKTWEMKNSHGLSLEQITSVSGIQNTYAGISGKSVEELTHQGIFPIQLLSMATNSDNAAKATFQIVAENLANLLFERITTLYSGWNGYFDFVNPEREKPDAKHPFNGLVFETIVIGQRLGDLFAHPKGEVWLARPVLKQLEQKIGQSDLPESCKEHYLPLQKIIRISQLREAPALGAGIDAHLTHSC
jgi:predicted NBD/HSP70 family sugar kinase